MLDKTIIIAGITGFIGEALSHRFLSGNYRLKGFTRSLEKARKLEKQGIEPVLWDGHSLTGWEKQLEGAAALIDLTGENIASGRWSQEKKNKILYSRVESGSILTEAIRQVNAGPGVYVQASAIGLYGACGDIELDEDSPAGKGFLAQVVKQWEASSDGVESLGWRRIICRFGVVLGRDGGVLKRMIIPFRWLMGGAIGSGQQWMSWIHIDDLARAIEFLISREACRGIFNCTAPHPVRNREFARTLGHVLHRPAFIAVPAWVLKILLGEMAEQVLLSGQQAVPYRLAKTGFTFRFPYLEEALKDLLKMKKTAGFGDSQSFILSR